MVYLILFYCSASILCSFALSIITPIVALGNFSDGKIKLKNIRKSITKLIKWLLKINIATRNYMMLFLNLIIWVIYYHMKSCHSFHHRLLFSNSLNHHRFHHRFHCHRLSYHHCGAGDSKEYTDF